MVKQSSAARPLSAPASKHALADLRPVPVNMPTDAAELARRAATGNRRAQREIYKRLKRPIQATLYRALGSNALLEDLLQETFIELFRSLPSYRGEADLRTWAHGITVRVAYRYLRERKRRIVEIPCLSISGVGAPERDPRLHLKEAQTPESELLTKERICRLDASLNALKPHYGVALVLFAINGLSLRQIAVATGATVMATKSRVSRARRLLTSRTP
jgi:RNA polymerase sigma-70 factor, ECF subfamily